MTRQSDKKVGARVVGRTPEVGMSAKRGGKEFGILCYCTSFTLETTQAGKIAQRSRRMLLGCGVCL
jgi:hypothetical protein